MSWLTEAFGNPDDARKLIVHLKPAAVFDVNVERPGQTRCTLEHSPLERHDSGPPAWVVRLPCESHGIFLKMARPKRLELLTPRFVVWGSTIEIIEVRSHKAASLSGPKPFSDLSGPCRDNGLKRCETLL